MILWNHCASSLHVHVRTRPQHVDMVLAALAGFLKPIEPDWDAILSQPDMTRWLSGVAELNARPIRQATPLTPLSPRDLSSIVRSAETNDVLVAYIGTIAFCCCMRLSELAANPGSQDGRMYVATPTPPPVTLEVPEAVA